MKGKGKILEALKIAEESIIMFLIKGFEEWNGLLSVFQLILEASSSPKCASALPDPRGEALEPI